MNPHEFIFRADLTRFWQLVHDIWQRARENGQVPPFELSADSQTPPRTTDTVVLTFFTHQAHSREALSIFADAAPDSGTTILTIFYEEIAFQDVGRPALRTWETLKRAWTEDELLVDPRAQYRPRGKRGPQERTRIALQRLREIRAEALRQNRPIPTKDSAMHQVGLTPPTWRKRDPLLWQRWYDPGFSPPESGSE